MPKKLHIDFETFSSVPLKSSGMYKYSDSLDFEILLIGYAFDDEPVKVVDLTVEKHFPAELHEALLDKNVIKYAHNAAFERLALKQYGYTFQPGEWRCTQVKAAFCGLPLALGQLSKVLKLGEEGKLSEGKALIRLFCVPCKPTKKNGGRRRNLPEHFPEKWERFKVYCAGDVVSERTVCRKLSKYHMPQEELDYYDLDQKINDRGVLVHEQFAKNAIRFDLRYKNSLFKRISGLTGIDNPNSPAQLKEWLSNRLGEQVKSLSKDTIPVLIESTEDKTVLEVLRLRQLTAKTSVKKYQAMLNCRTEQGRAHGLLQFYGANRTGRWAGRLVQVQNLPKNKISPLEIPRDLLIDNNYNGFREEYPDVSVVLSQLIRSCLIPSKGKRFVCADFSAIEARVIAWLSGESWRQEVFASHGMIYESSASKMFGVPMEKITKGSELRAKGKVAELALGYQGAIGALKKMGADKMGLSDAEMNSIVKKWRRASPSIVRLWKSIESAAIRAVKHKTTTRLIAFRGIEFNYDGDVMTIKLPSGRKLYYQKPILRPGKYDSYALYYWGMNQTKKTWSLIDTYGGKLTENIVQAISRDVLAIAMYRLDLFGYDLTFHVHDEAIAECSVLTAQEDLKLMCDIMSWPIDWAQDLQLSAEGYVGRFYKKD